MQKILPIVLAFFLSCEGEKNLTLLNPQGVYFLLENDTLEKFSNGFNFGMSLYKDSGNAFCGSSLNMNCINSNRDGYDVCLNLMPINTNTYKILSSDSCVTNYFHNKGNTFKAIAIDDLKVDWDSVIICYQDFNIAKKVISKSKFGLFKEAGHPLNINQEMVFLVVYNIGPKSLETTLDNMIFLDVYNNGKIIKQFNGNLFPQMLKSLQKKVYEVDL